MTVSPPNGHDHTAAGAPYAQTSGADRRTLDAIFRHPLAHNLSWREVVSLFTAIGEAEEKHNGEVVLRAGEDTLAMKRPHHKDLAAQDVMDIRHFLATAGWSPGASASPDTASTADAPGLIVVIDHAGARIYQVDLSPEADHARGAEDLGHLLHHLDRKAHDRDRDETYPADERFFEKTAHALAAPGAIVLIGRGKGQSREADHLRAYLLGHHKDIHARIARVLVADLSHLTAPQLIALGREGLCA